MNTSIITAEIKTSDVPLFKELLKKFKAKSIKVEEKDPTKMTKEEFFAKIDKARQEPTKRMTREEHKAFLGI
ncbi:hypothetical protein PG294_09850 [Riemerella anatipestifer]|uniref:hypothetical protein n=3 Tax=Riemerella anatipestifer TaxID=34085 RepID=UPI0007EDA64F|nr:hypothetical protein [Riemerella anatipestifer]MBT0574304.1 hypothetical protein [Riemerella anatipestifer]MCQ4155893.1 hypothetical protein [Riemerella anatipestifer]MCT6723675.1 hypothetical protein [Riemerella anatipestifer]MCU7569299.1 hypothetical protein [Riemerella anatipestifer]MCW0491300.1 hypothetical protein [Riemerella anatipestifer]